MILPNLMFLCQKRDEPNSLKESIPHIHTHIQPHQPVYTCTRTESLRYTIFGRTPSPTVTRRPQYRTRPWKSHPETQTNRSQLASTPASTSEVTHTTFPAHILVRRNSSAAQPNRIADAPTSLYYRSRVAITRCTALDAPLAILTLSRPPERFYERPRFCSRRYS